MEDVVGLLREVDGGGRETATVCALRLLTGEVGLFVGLNVEVLGEAVC